MEVSLVDFLVKASDKIIANEYCFTAKGFRSSTQAIGTRWLDEGSSLILFVPSVAVPAGLENIAVINPRHPQINELKLVSVESRLYNDRAFKGLG